MIFELSSQVLKCRPAHGQEGSLSDDDWRNLELAIIKKFESFPNLHLEIDDSEFGIYRLHIEIDTELTSPQRAVDLLKYGVRKLTSFVAGWNFITE